MADTKDNRYGSILYSVVLKAREVGERAPGSGEAFAAYQIIDTALQEAEAWGVSAGDLGLEGFNPKVLLKGKAAA